MSSWIRQSFASLRALIGAARCYRPFWFFSLGLFAIDLFWIGYFVIAKGRYELGYGPSLYFHKEMLLTTDGGHPELFGYAQTLLLVVLFVRLLRWTRQPIYLVLGLIFLVVLLDDALQLHEVAGVYLSEELGLPKLFGVRRRDVGEVVAYGILGAVTLPLLVYGLFRSRAEHRGNGLAFMIPLGGLAFCAIGVDLVYRMLKDLFKAAGVLIDAIEDGGELVTITLGCLLALGALRLYRPQAAPADRSSPPSGSASADR